MSAAGNEHTACLGLGSNIDPEHYMPLAVEALREQLEVLCVSRAWRFPAHGTQGPDFLNAAIKVRTAFSAEALKAEVLLPLEAELGRQRGADKYAPRSIDIDILVYDDKVLDFNIWTLAHLAIPLAECAPELREPRSRQTLKQIAGELRWRAKARRTAVL
ncbi:MAG: 2-amino-4-hydroxy-6-hydroxymethyldihydropteridine diphosphokinase [Anaerolineales bacterium]|nr:2-amino-4-hydroxy-6-hydroxymethyldihydropteridine diphosphokinase [Anaerolineales bacterium]